jgi:hypothetical protein
MPIREMHMFRRFIGGSERNEQKKKEKYQKWAKKPKWGGSNFPQE